MALSFNRNLDVGRIVRKLVYTVLTLYVGGTITTTFGTVMNETASPFYSGLSLIGWTVGTFPAKNATNFWSDCAGTVDNGITTAVGSNCITQTTGTGVLSVIGVIAIASIVMEFVRF